MVNRDNPLSRHVSQICSLDSEKTSVFLGIYICGLAVVVIPSLLSVIFQMQWLNILTFILFVAEVVVANIYIDSGKLK